MSKTKRKNKTKQNNNNNCKTLTFLSLWCVFMFQRILQSVSSVSMGKIVLTYAALTVCIITDVTGLQDNATMGVNPDG